MLSRSRPFAGGLMASVAALAIASGFFMVDSTARSMADPSAQTVNRALKDNRFHLGLQAFRMSQISLLNGVRYAHRFRMRNCRTAAKPW